MKVDLSVIIPCFNEERNLKRGVLDEIYHYLSRQKYSWEVLICDDGSTDNSRQLALSSINNKKNFKLLSLDHGGKPSAIYGGLKAANGRISLFSDMDQSTPITEIDKLLPFFEDGFDLVIGSRGLHRKNFSLIRKLASVIFRYLRAIFILPHIIDTQCGFKAVKTELARQIFPFLSYFNHDQLRSGWSVSAYDAELLYIANKWGYKIKEVPVKWQDEDASDTKNRSLSRFARQSVQMAQEVINVIKNNRQGRYNLPSS